MIQGTIPVLSAVFAGAATFIGTGAFVPAVLVGVATGICGAVGLAVGAYGGAAAGAIGTSLLGATFGKVAGGNKGAVTGGGIGLVGGGSAGFFLGGLIGGIAGAMGGYNYTHDLLVPDDTQIPPAQMEPHEGGGIGAQSYMDLQRSNPDPIIVVPTHKFG